LVIKQYLYELHASTSKMAYITEFYYNLI